jgi:hypothetical protein
MNADCRPLEEEPEFFLSENHVERLLRVAAAARFGEIAQLHEFLSTQLDREWVGNALSLIRERSAEHGYSPYAVPEDVIGMLLAYWARNPESFAETDLATEIQLGLAEAIEQAPDEL